MTQFARIRRATVAVAFCALLVPVGAGAQEAQVKPKSAGPVVTDALIVRPMMVVRTLFGVGTFLVSLPFTAPGDHVAEAAEVLVLEPARKTFLRPLGEHRE